MKNTSGHKPSRYRFIRAFDAFFELLEPPVDALGRMFLSRRFAAVCFWVLASMAGLSDEGGGTPVGRLGVTITGNTLLIAGLLFWLIPPPPRSP
jgi:hypothetical protein